MRWFHPEYCGGWLSKIWEQLLSIDDFPFISSDFGFSFSWKFYLIKMIHKPPTPTFATMTNPMHGNFLYRALNSARFPKVHKNVYGKKVYSLIFGVSQFWPQLAKFIRGKWLLIFSIHKFLFIMYHIIISVNSPKIFLLLLKIFPNHANSGAKNVLISRQANFGFVKTTWLLYKQMFITSWVRP